MLPRIAEQRHIVQRAEMSGDALKQVGGALDF